MQVLNNEALIAKLQANVTDGKIYCAYFTRDREYSFYEAKNLGEIVATVIEKGHKGDTFDAEFYNNSELHDNTTISFRSDEWIIFGTEELAREFLEDLNCLDNSNEL